MHTRHEVKCGVHNMFKKLHIPNDGGCRILEWQYCSFTHESHLTLAVGLLPEATLSSPVWGRVNTVTGWVPTR